jgi:hypothetical protein
MYVVCLKVKFGEAGFLLDTQMKYESATVTVLRGITPKQATLLLYYVHSV